MKRDNIIKILLIFFSILVLLSILGYAYAYFSLRIEGTPKDVIVSTGDLRLEYKDETELKLDGAFPGDSVKKVVTVKNVGTKNVTYSLYWGDLINTIGNYELHVTLDCKSYTNYGETTQAESGTCDNIYRAVPMSDTVTTGTIKGNISIDPKITHEYSVTITFDDKNYDQSYNKNKSFKGKIGIQEYTAPAVTNCTFDGELTQGAEYVNGQYTYRYMQEGKYADFRLAWQNITSDGWGVQLTDKASTDAVTSKVCTYINNKPIVSMSYMFGGSKATTLDVSNFDTSKVTYMNGMFSNSQATTLDVSNFDTSNVTDMSNMFDGSKATTLDLSNFDTSNVTDMSSMFHSSQVTTLDVSNFNTSNVTDMDSMFYYSQATTLDLSNFDTSKVTNMKYMFQSSQATTLDVSSFDTSKVTNMTNMFLGSQATTLDVSNFDTSNVTNMISMFSYSKATTLDVSNFDTSKVTNMSYMFYNFTNLKTIYVSNKFNTDKVTDSTNMFSGCTNLVGGAGTKYNSSYVDKKYARIDGGTSNPGYFTDIADKPSEPNSFATDSWKTIINAVKNNNIGKYNVGDTKTINMGTYGTHTLRLANKSTPSECSGTGFSQTACGFVLEFADLITTHPMNDSATNTGGWPATTMRTFVNDSIYNALPSDLRNSIINTTVVSGIGSSDSSGSATCFKSTDKLYLLAPREIYNNYDGTYDTANSLTRTLDYYITQGVTTTNYSGAIKRGENISYNQWWWLRNANSQLNYSFSMVYDNGSFINNFGANQSIGVSPAFRIG